MAIHMAMWVRVHANVQSTTQPNWTMCAHAQGLHSADAYSSTAVISTLVFGFAASMLTAVVGESDPVIINNQSTLTTVVAKPHKV